MQNNLELEITINRIRQMESIFDQLQSVLQYAADSLYEDESLQEMLQALTKYYESGQWLKDYESDERGELPMDLKRGILSQDGIYHLLFEIEQRGGVRNGK